MTNYFFISSPLHFCLAANIALQNRTHRNVALIMTRDRLAGDAYVSAIMKHPQIFESVISLSRTADGEGGLDKKERQQLLRELFSKTHDMRVFTGNDRRYEFQYAMYIATRSNSHVEGVYLDDGAVTYVGHKSLDKLQHRYVDPLAKKLFRGWWWKNSLTTGASAWIDSAYVAFPEEVHPLLKRKQLNKIDAGLFKSCEFTSLASELIADSELLKKHFANIRVVLTLPVESAFLDKRDVYSEVYRNLLGFFKNSEVAVKAHPRSKNLELLEELFPGALLLDRRVGMEFLLPLLDDECLVIGDISTALLTSKWLRPDLSALALEVFGTVPEALMSLYDKLDIEIISPEDLSSFLLKCTENH